jgi:probable FeS assembly SUF system protein SufT
MRQARTICLERDLPGVAVPAGYPVTLRAGEVVAVVQALGGSVTLQSVRGELVRVGARELDALGSEAGGYEAGTTLAPVSAPGTTPVEGVLEQLRQVYDPEIPVNVVDLGLVYRCEAAPLEQQGGWRVEIDLSMTAPGCGMGDILAEEAGNRALAVPGVAEVRVELVWDPPWDLSRLSDAARLQLGLI